MKLYPTPPSILTLVTWVQRTQAGLRPSPHVSWPLGLRPLAIKILTLPALLAAGAYIRLFGPNESLIVLKPTRILDSMPHYTALSCPTALFPTPPSILTLVTWIQRMQAWSLANSAHRLAFGQTKSASVQPRLPLAATISPAGRLRVFFY